jgi:hypothetical protein
MIVFTNIVAKRKIKWVNRDLGKDKLERLLRVLDEMSEIQLEPKDKL